MCGSANLDPIVRSWVGRDPVEEQRDRGGPGRGAGCARVRRPERP